MPKGRGGGGRGGGGGGGGGRKGKKNKPSHKKRGFAHSMEEIQARNMMDAKSAADRRRRRGESSEEEDSDGSVGGGAGAGAGASVDAGSGGGGGGRAAAFSRGRGMPPSDSESEDDEPRTRKAKGVEGLIEVHNPNKNKQQARNIKVKDMGSLDGKVVLTRREREEIERQNAARAYQAKHKRGETKEAKSDLARLAAVRKRREDAKRRRELEAQAKAEKTKGKK